MSHVKTLTFSSLKDVLVNNAAAIRCVTKLLPAGGEGDKVFPPTYEGGTYATEERISRAEDGSLVKIPSVVLDSVQSQANRLEFALQRGFDEEKLKFPLITVDFAKDEKREFVRDVGRISALQAPHRIADAILRDSELNGKRFRASEPGLRFGEARTTNATPLFELCPTAFIFGIWDSTGPRGGLGAKFARALVSEIVGYAAVPGVRSSSRLDPLGIEREGVVLYDDGNGGWTLDPATAKKNGSKPVLLGKDGKPSEANHGNITPSLRDKNKQPNPGGFTISHALQTTVLSLPALRRLRFPIKRGEEEGRRPETDLAAQVALAALALAAVAWQHRDGYDLRSRCLLDPVAPPVFEVVGQGQKSLFSLDADEAAALLDAAGKEAEACGLKWNTTPLVLRPSENLRLLVIKSREKTAAAPVEG